MASGTIRQRIPNNLGTAIDIKEYNSVYNRYTCPCDGYLRVQAAASSSSATTAVVIGADGDTSKSAPTISAKFLLGNTFSSMFVRKGMQIYISVNTGNDSAFFIPLV